MEGKLLGAVAEGPLRSKRDAVSQGVACSKYNEAGGKNTKSKGA